MWDGHRNSNECSDMIRLRQAVNLTLIASVLSKSPPPHTHTRWYASDSTILFDKDTFGTNFGEGDEK